MNGLQRAVESWRYVLLRWEHWLSPGGDMREWLRRNCYVVAWLLVPAVLVMPVIGLSRLVRRAYSFSKHAENHLDAIRLFITTYNLALPRRATAR